MAEGTCGIDDCGKRIYSRGWCRAHYKRWQRYGDPLGRPQRPSAQERFWPKVNKNGPVPEYAPHLGPCWLWTAATSEGYGSFWLDGHQQLAHRLSYEWLVRPIPDDLQIDHLCRVHACVNPAHLEPVTVKVNLLRGTSPSAENAIKTHCPADHEYTEANTYREPDGSRQCKTCSRDRQREAWNLVSKGLGLPGERTHCPQDHLYDEANTYWYKGSRSCRACKNEKQRARRAASA